MSFWKHSPLRLLVLATILAALSLLPGRTLSAWDLKHETGTCTFTGAANTACPINYGTGLGGYTRGILRLDVYCSGTPDSTVIAIQYSVRRTGQDGGQALKNCSDGVNDIGFTAAEITAGTKETCPSLQSPAEWALQLTPSGGGASTATTCTWDATAAEMRSGNPPQ